MAKGFTDSNGKFRPTGNSGRTSSREKSTETSGMKMKGRNSVRISNANRDNRFFSDHAFVLTLKNETGDDIPIEFEVEDKGFKIITESEEVFFNFDGEKVDLLDEEIERDVRISNSRSDNRFFSDHEFVLTMKNDSTGEDVNVDVEVEDTAFKIITEREELYFNFDGEMVDFPDEDVSV